MSVACTLRRVVFCCALLALLAAWLPPCWAEQRGEGFTFIVAGDHFEEPPEGMVENMLRFRPVLVASTGDLIFRSKPRDFRRFQRVILRPLERIGCRFYPCMGNHDFPVEPNWRKFWGQPRGRHYYSFDYGEAHFVFLDSNRAAVGDREYKVGSEPYFMQRQGEPLHPGSRQYRWLVEDLAGTDKPFVFVFFHHPVLSFGGHRGLPALQRHLAPVFEKYRVTAVFNGHSHGYERFVPARAVVRGNKVQMVADPQRGVPYIVTASGSNQKNLYDITRNPLHATFKKAPNFVVVRIAAGVARCQVVEPPQGRVIDTFTLRPRTGHRQPKQRNSPAP